MVSDPAKNYAIGNLLAGPSQWKRLYATGSSVAFAVNMLLVYLQIIPPLSSGSTEVRTEMIVIVMLELVNAMMPLVAVAFDRPLKAIFTVVLYIATGLAYWTLKYEAATR